MKKTGVAAVMIGRAALSDPGIFAKLKNAGAEPSSLTKIDWCRRHLEAILAFRAALAVKFPHDHVPGEDAFASVKMHTHLFRYFSGRPGAAALRARLNTVRTLAEISDILASE
jgi:tRNA-dihydrouridine synthase